MLDSWKGKKVTIMGNSGKLETNWGVIATGIKPDPFVTAVKLNEFGLIAERKTIPLQQFLDWQNQNL